MEENCMFVRTGRTITITAHRLQVQPCIQVSFQQVPSCYIKRARCGSQQHTHPFQILTLQHKYQLPFPVGNNQFAVHWCVQEGKRDVWFEPLDFSRQGVGSSCFSALGTFFLENQLCSGSGKPVSIGAVASRHQQ